jgi:hypothetical protein
VVEFFSSCFTELLYMRRFIFAHREHVEYSRAS